MSLKTYEPAQLSAILSAHKEWVKSYGERGTRADLHGSNLGGSNLSGSDLRDSNLSGSDLRGSNLRGSNLSGSDLRGSNLSGSNLSGSNLSDSNLHGSNLSGSNLHGSNLRGSNLSGSDLRGSNLHGSNLHGSNLSGSNLSGSNLSGSNLSGSDLSGLKDETNTIWPTFWSIPEVGTFQAFKAVRINGKNGIAQIEIPAEAQRTSSLIGRKCRAEFAKVISITDSSWNPVDEARSIYAHDSFVYRVGEIVRPDKYDPDFHVECSHGIHFYITRQEALDHR